MRFKADISNTSQLTRLITSLAPLSKVSTLKLKADVVHLICQGERGGVQVWSQIAVNSIFKVETLRLESNSSNEIYLEVATDALARALKSAAGSTKSTIKLAKKGGEGPNGTGRGSHPVLSIDIESASRMGKKLEITQDVFVTVKKAQDVALLKEPLCPVPDAALLLPPLQILRTVAERMKTISSIITLSANNAGTFKMRAVSDEASVDTEWTNLKRPNLGDDNDEMTNPNEDPNKMFSVSLETKNLLKFLNSYQIAQTTIFCLCPNHCGIFYVYVGDSKDNLQGGVLTFFVPAFNADGDD
ncbi:uncharacterized protein JCM6883_002497 [Sporobolomyces salmoneus]|uniref:uncharacterized protein n=1 Tax=Sporobolomyces salmoneus TaxID=183962 RepID=UPI003180DC06